MPRWFYCLLLQEERHHSMSELSAPPTDSLAFHVDRIPDRAPDFSRSTSGYKGHRASHIVGIIHTTSAYFCDHCRMYGHTVDRCYKIHGYPPKSRPAHNKRVVAPVINLPSAGSEHTGLTKD